MMCPLLWIGWMISTEFNDPADTECLKRQCAWWDPQAKRCSALAIAQRL